MKLIITNLGRKNKIYAGDQIVGEYKIIED